MISTSGSTHSRMSPRMLLPVVDVVEVDVLLLERRRASASGRSSFGPGARELRLAVLTGSLNLPLISPVDLLKSMLLTLPSSTGVHELRVREVGLRRAAAGEAAHDERGGDEREHDPRHPAQRRRAATRRRLGAARRAGARWADRRSAARRAGASSGRHDGGGVGGRPFGRGRAPARRRRVRPRARDRSGGGSSSGRLLVVGRPMLRPGGRSPTHATAGSAVRDAQARPGSTADARRRDRAAVPRSAGSVARQ